MERYRNYLEKLRNAISYDEHSDGFPSGELRRKILHQIAALSLPKNTDEYNNFLRFLNKEA